ncbi:putative Mu-like prophage FluMu DNA circulation protein (plasmid) [Ralstonia solanacearum CMR15]|nr:putative Mu-like prophage FluMu DNA circulation protein [Ralstonia solanacearum CMR15]
MSWKDRLVGASFRGVDFLTENHEARGGRRLVVHEFPGAEDPEVEDLGAKAWEWKLNAYFIGHDYDLGRDEFLAQLNQPGPDWLLHPWLGDLWVRAHQWSVHESNDKGGYCAITIEFVPGGGTVADAETDVVDVADDLNGNLADAVEADFSLESMSFDSMSAFVAVVQQKLEGLRQALSLATLPLTWASQVMNIIQGIKTDLGALMRVPTDYANAMRSLTTALGGGADDAVYTAAGHDLTAATISTGATGGANAAASTVPAAKVAGGVIYPATLRPRVVSRLAGLAVTPLAVSLSGAAANDGAVRRNLVREEALRSRLLVTAAVEVALTAYQAEGDRDAALASVVVAIDALLPSMDDVVFQAAVAARAAITQAMLAQDLKPASARDVVNAEPATVLARRLAVDESVFLARNAVRHPLFVKGRVYG